MNDCWISTSLFSEKKNWGEIIQNGIRPILLELAIECFRIRFNYFNGANIQLSLLSNKHQCESIAKRLDAYFKCFFLNAKLRKARLPLPNDSLFIYYPSNSIQYGLYSLDVKFEEQGGDVYQLLSEIIIDSFWEDVDDASILTLLLYLHLTLIKVTYNFFEFNVKNPTSYFLEKYPLYQTKNNSYKDFFNKNKAIIDAIMFDVFVKNFMVGDDLFWLNRWVEVCKRELDKSPKNIDAQCSSLIKMIDNHLGPNTEMKQFLNGIIHEIMHLKWKFLKQRTFPVKV